LLASVRCQPGYERFMMPESFADLIASSKRVDGYIVLVTASTDACDVILLGGPTSPIHLRLAALNVDQLEKMCRSFRTAVRNERSRQSDDASRGMKKVPASSESSSPSADEIVLSDLWNTLAKPIIDSLGLKVCLSLPP
jgi:hypothetical protein